MSLEVFQQLDELMDGFDGVVYFNKKYLLLCFTLQSKTSPL
jgi:hypothetical protein